MNGSTSFKRVYLHYTDKEECHCTRKSHMNHSESYWIWKIEVFWGENPLQMSKSREHSMLFTWIGKGRCLIFNNINSRSNTLVKEAGMDQIKALYVKPTKARKRLQRCNYNILNGINSTRNYPSHIQDMPAN